MFKFFFNEEDKMKKKIKSSLAKTVTLGVSAATVVTMLPVNAMAMEKVPA